MRIAHLVLFTTIIFVATTAHAASIKQRSYVYQYDCAKGLQDESYLICGNCDDDRPTQAVALSFRVSQRVVPEAQPPSQSVVSPLDTIHFHFDSASLLPNAKARLDTVDGSGGVRLAGYTCTIGSAAYNDKLSQRRADTVARYLTRRGISILSSTGFGESTAYPGHAKNRRVEISVERKEKL